LRDEEGEDHMARRRTLYLPVMIAAAVLVACAMALLVAISEKAGAAFPGKNGRIAFQGTDGVIYTIDPIKSAGGGRTEVASGEQPSFSSDGTKIAFAASDGHDAEIYTVNLATGGDPFPVTANDKDDLHPSYSPDGRRIAYTCSDGHDAEICTISATGGKPFRLTRNARLDFGPSWSPGGKRIAYSGVSRTDWEVYTIGVRGGGRFNVTKNDAYDYYPDYSPNGKRIAYAARGKKKGADTEIRTIKATGGRSFQLTDNRMVDLAPSYSPDGKRIAYTHYSDPGLRAKAAAIYKIAANGGRGALVTANGGKGALYPSWGSRP
jgi:Tol biopolymer transport system component